jgi:hypothetical protein
MERKMNIKPKTYTKLVNFKISPEEYEILKAIADSEKKSASELFRMFIREKGQSYIDWKEQQAQNHWDSVEAGTF